jgi:hypothetical protein
VGETDEAPAGTIRLWRLRKRSLYVDAELRPIEGTSEISLSIFYGTMLTWSARYANRGDAIADARSRRAELEREGWTFHW